MRVANAILLSRHLGMEDFEFIELQNVSAQPMPLAGFKFGDGVEFTFGAMMLAPGAFTLVVSNLAAFESRYGAGFNVAGEFTGSLNNAGEMVELLGINLPRVLNAVFGLGCALAAIAGVLAAPLWTVSPSMSANAVMPAFVVVAIGGLGSFLGAVVAGLAVGVVTALTIQFWPEASAGAMYALMFTIMLLRPRGLFGEKWERFE